MSLRQTLILLILAIVTATAAIVVEWNWPVAQSRRAIDDERVVERELDPEALTTIELERPDRTGTMTRYRFEHTPDGWMQREPFAYPMSGYSLRQFPRLVNALRSEDRIDPDAEGLTAEALGLDPPRGVLALTDITGRRVELELGRRGVGGRAYLRHAGAREVFVVDQSVHDRALEHDPKEWRDRRLFLAAGQETTRIVIARGALDVAFERERRTWRMTSPVRTRVNDDALQEIFDALGRAATTGFILDEPADLAPFGLTTPAGSVTVETLRAREVDGEIVREPIVERVDIGERVSAGQQDHFGIAAGRPAVIQVPEAFIRVLFAAPQLMVDPTASGIEAADVHRVRISVDEADFVLQRQGRQWIAPDAANRPVPAEAAERLLTTLTTARATQIRFDRFPRDASVGFVVLLNSVGEAIDTVQIARDANGGWILENGDQVLRIHNPSLDLPLAPAAFGLEP